VNIGKFLKDLGRGGGGHPGAAGQAIPTVERDEFIGMVAENLFAPK
jgi:nanoRNase/pAp phosphatase (c-di-AMP/oligoRNAs hydrolase)